MVERERERERGGDGKEREGGQRVDQNVGQKDIKRETEAKKKRRRRRKRRRRSQPHTAPPLFLKVKENRSVKRRERRRVPPPSPSSSQSFPSSSRRSIPKGRPSHPNGFPSVGFPRPPGPPFEWLMTLSLFVSSRQTVAPNDQSLGLFGPQTASRSREGERGRDSRRKGRSTHSWMGGRGEGFHP